MSFFLPISDCILPASWNNRVAQLLLRLQYQHTLKILWSVLQIQTYSDLRGFGAHCLSLMRWVNFRDAVAFKPSCLIPHPQPFAKLIWQRRLANVQKCWFLHLNSLTVASLWPSCWKEKGICTKFTTALVNPIQKKKSKTMIGHFNWFHQIHTLWPRWEKDLCATTLACYLYSEGRKEAKETNLALQGQ